MLLLFAATPRPYAEPLRAIAMQWNDQLNGTRAPIIVAADTPKAASGRLLAAGSGRSRVRSAAERRRL